MIQHTVQYESGIRQKEVCLQSRIRQDTPTLSTVTQNDPRSNNADGSVQDGSALKWACHVQ